LIWEFWQIFRDDVCWKTLHVQIDSGRLVEDVAFDLYQRNVIYSIFTYAAVPQFLRLSRYLSGPVSCSNPGREPECPALFTDSMNPFPLEWRGFRTSARKLRLHYSSSCETVKKVLKISRSRTSISQPW